MAGYKYWFEDHNLVTIWSAPNYCYRCGNVAAILDINAQMEREFQIFHATKNSQKAVPIRQIVPYFLWQIISLKLINLQKNLIT